MNDIIDNRFDEAYHQMLCRILNDGVEKKDRTGTGTRSIFGHMMRFDLAKGFPLITTKKIPIRLIIHELLWMLSGSSRIDYLREHNVKIWDEWADAKYRPEMGYEDGELGPVYGVQWRSWPGRTSLQQDGKVIRPGEEVDIAPGKFALVTHQVDQIADIIDTLQENPWSRRIMLSSWNVAEVPKMKLPPCHFNAQFNVTPGEGLNKLNCLMNIRSWDVFLGGPFNIAQYALLTMMLAHITDLELGDLVIASGDTHLYLNHLEQAREQVNREPRAAPRMTLDPNVGHIDDFVYESFTLEGYDPHAHIKGEVSV